MGDGDSSKRPVKARAGAAPEQHSKPPLAKKLSTSGTAPGNSVASKVESHEGQLELQAAIIAELLYEECSDNRVRALQAAQRGLTICREIVTDREELAYGAGLERGVTQLERQLGGQSGGVVTSDEAPPFNPPGGATH